MAGETSLSQLLGGGAGSTSAAADSFIATDEKVSGPSFTSYTANTDVTRDLQTVRRSQSWASLAANQVTLQPGKYRFRAWQRINTASGSLGSGSIRNISDGLPISTDGVEGANGRRRMDFQGTLVFSSGTKIVDLRFNSNQGGTASGGLVQGVDGVFQYSEIEIFRLGDA